MSAETPQHLAELSDTPIVNALTTPTVASVHDHTRAPVDVVISDPALFASKRAAMIAGGASKLQLIADFDRTVSAFLTSNGEVCRASHNLLEMCVQGDRAESFQSQMDAINTKYFALEIAHDISEEQRAEYMREWWTQAHELLLAQGISAHRIADTIAACRADGTLELRAGAKPFLSLLSSASIPVCIFSAGLKETIRQTLVQESALLPNVHLIGNEMIFHSESGILERFTPDLITSSNKNYSHVRVQAPEFFQQTTQVPDTCRPHVILMGDNIGDANMALGMEVPPNETMQVIKIGILLDRVEARLEQFKQAFDVVLLNDPSFEFVHKLVQEIIGGGSSSSSSSNGSS